MKPRVFFVLILSFQINLCVGQTVLKYYGVTDASYNQFSFVRDSLMGNVTLVTLQTDTSGWRFVLTEAEKNNLKLIIWPLGNGQRYTPWKFDVLKWAWDLSQGLDALKFAEQYTVSGGKALLAVLMSHEPFYSQGEAIFTSAQLKLLYTAMKNVAPHVLTYIYMNDMAYYDARDPNRQMEDGIMDICGTFLHGFGTKNTTAQTLQEIDDDYALIQRKGLHMQLFFAMQAFGEATSDYRMPLASEMLDIGTKILEKRKLDGAMWYPWNRASTAYTSWLSKDRYDSLGGDRWDVVRQLSRYRSVTDVQERVSPPAEFCLLQNYPNPFNPSTSFEFRISNFSAKGAIPPSSNHDGWWGSASGGGFVSLKIFDVLGREVAMLVNETRPAGGYTIRWDASSLPSGVYFYRLQAGTLVETKKLVLAK